MSEAIMSDKFIDELYDNLERDRQAELTKAATDTERRQRLEAARHAWWLEFVEDLGHKVGAWNEKLPTNSPVNFTKRENGHVLISHRVADADLRLQGDGVLVRARLGGRESSGEGPLIQFGHDAEWNLVVTSEGQQIATPTAAAEKVIEPLLRKVFEGS
jgi:hypothetical protein